jgi:hypothetical protein
MANGNYSVLKDDIDDNIKQNGDGDITGQVLQTQLFAMITSLGAGYQFMGVAKLTPTPTDPGSPDQNVFYVAFQPGIYSNFGSQTVADGEIAILKWNGSWTKEVTGAATAAQVTELGQEVDEVSNDVYGIDDKESGISITSWSPGVVDKGTGYINSAITEFKCCYFTSIADYAAKDDAKLVLTMPKTIVPRASYGMAFYARMSAMGYISGVGIAQSDADGVETIEIPIPATARVFRTTFWATDTYGEFSAKVIYKERGRSYEERLTALEGTTEMLDNIPKTANYAPFELGSINLSTGAEVDSTTIMRSGFIPMASFINYNLFGSEYRFFVDSAPFSPGTAYYDSNKSYLGYTQSNIINNGHAITDVAYIRFIVGSTSTSGVVFNVDDIWYVSNELDVARYTDIFTEAKALPSSAHAAEITQLDTNKVTIPEISGIANPYVIRVTSQAELDNIKASINTAISNGETKILVYFTADKLEFANSALQLDTTEYPSASNVDIEFRASENCIIYPKANRYSADEATQISGGKFVFAHADPFDFQKCYFSEDKEVSLLSEIRQFSAVAVATGNTDGSGNPEYKIALPEEDATVYHQDLWIEIFHNYRGKFFPVSNISGGYVYFYDIYGVDRSIAISIQNNVILNYRWCNSSDGDVYVSNGYIYTSLKYPTINESKASQLFVIGEAFNSVLISGLSVHFSSDNYVEPRGSYTKTETPLILVTGFNSGNSASRFVKVEKCVFYNIRNVVMYADDTSNNIIYAENVGKDCYKFECNIGNNHGGYIYANRSTGGNRFIDHYWIYSCVSQENGLVADNVIKDFCHSAINCGGGVDSTAASVIVERNLIEYSDSYADNAFHLGDCGAIYAYREAQLLIVRDNIVCNYRGTFYAPSIYMDGYISNCKVYRNLIINNSPRYVYGNNSAFDISMLADNNDALTYTGKNRFCGLNILTGRINMNNRSSDTDSILAMNIEIHTDKVNWLPDTYGNIAKKELPFHIFNASVFSDRVSFPLRYYFTQWEAKWNFRREILQRINFNKN